MADGHMRCSSTILPARVSGSNIRLDLTSATHRFQPCKRHQSRRQLPRGSLQRRLIHLRSQPRVDRLRLQGQHAEHRLVHPPQRLPAGHPVQGLEAQRVLPQRQRPLPAQVAVPQSGQVVRQRVVRAVNDPEVVRPAHLDPGLGWAIRATHETSRWLDHHALAAAPGQLGPPAGAGRHRARVGGVHQQAAGALDEPGRGVGQPPGQGQMPAVVPLVIGIPLGGQ